MFWKRFYFVVVLLSCNCFLVCSNKVCEGVKNFFGCGQSETISTNSSPGSVKKTTLLKCVFLSSTPCVGKTSIIRYLSDKIFVEKYTATIGFDAFSKTYEVENSPAKILMSIWDCSADKSLKQMIGDLMRNALAVVFVYDVTSKVSFDNLQNYITDVKEQAPEQCLFFLLGNKLDLASEEQRQVTTEEAKKFAEDNGLIFLGECSAKTNTYMPVQELYYKKENLQDGKCTEGLDGMLKDIVWCVQKKDA